MSSVIEIKPLTRVEGHGIVRVYMSGNKAERVELDLNEPPRLFEALLKGKHYTELPDIICRICSLCSTIHRVTSLLAVEAALGIPVSTESMLYRQLIVHGGHIQSHALHLFCLALPDYLDLPGLPQMAQAKPDLLKLGLKIKGVGNLIQEVVGGRLIHPVNVKIGGIGKRVSREDLLNLRLALEDVLPDIQLTVDLFASFDLPRCPLPTPTLMSVTGGIPLFGDVLRTSTGVSYSSADYLDLLQEKEQQHSHGKRSTAGDEVVTVGALARLVMGMPLHQHSQQVFSPLKEKLIQGGMWSNNIAQAIELLYAAESALSIISKISEGELGPEQPGNAKAPHLKGTATTEAPRGVLIHSYGFDHKGSCTAADIITPTAINQAAMERDLLALAQALEGVTEKDLCLMLEMLIRAYDPCISCAVHMVKV